MKEAFEDRITRRIKEVMEQYEPEYSPQAWKEFRKQKLQRENWRKRFFLDFRYWFNAITITFILIIVIRILSPSVLEKEAVVFPQRSESVNHHESKEINEISVPEKPVTLSSDGSKADTTTSKESTVFNYLPVCINDSLHTNNGNKIQVVNEIPVMTDSIEKVPAGSDIFRAEDFGNQFNNTQLISLEIKTIEISSLTYHTSERTRQYKLQLPELNSLTTESKKYNKFIGPNKLSLFYSPEINYCCDPFKTSVISHGFGIIFEGPVRSFISISAGLSYQSVNFNNIIFSKHVPMHMSPPIDHFYLFRYKIYIDSIGIITSGSYKYIELPVSANLKFLEGTRSQVWLGTGISSMAFLRQNFASEVNIETIAGDISEKVGISPNVWKNIHPLASINFSLIYRFQFSDRLFLNSAIRYRLYPEPLGYYSMKMSHLNLQIGLGYRFGRED